MFLCYLTANYGINLIRAKNFGVPAIGKCSTTNLQPQPKMPIVGIILANYGAEAATVDGLQRINLLHWFELCQEV